MAKGNRYDNVVRAPFVVVLDESTRSRFKGNLTAYKKWIESNNGDVLLQTEAEELGILDPTTRICSIGFVEPTRRASLRWESCDRLEVTFLRSNPVSARVSLFYNKFTFGGSENYLDLLWTPGRWILWNYESGPIS